MGESRSCQKFKSLKKCSWFDSDSKSESKSDDHAKENMNQNSNNTNRCSVISKLLLPEDLMFGIFTLVPLYCLINSARYVCKSWASIIGSFYFVEACERKPGLFVHNRIDQSLSYFLEFKDDVNGQFEITPLGTPPKMGHVICSCDGMLVLSNYEHQYFVVNPILKCSFIIPHLGIKWYDVFVARVPHTTEFKLFCAAINLHPCGYWCIFYVLRIGIDNSWKKIIRRKAPTPPFYLDRHRPLKGAGNALYWILPDVVAVIDIDKEIIVREYPIPHRQFKNRLPMTYFIMGNHLSCILKKTSTSYQLCILNFDSGEWSPYCDLGPYDFVAACGHEIDILYWLFCCLINDQIILKVHVPGNGKCDKNRLYHLYFGYNLKTKQLTKIGVINKGTYDECCHTNSLVLLPSTPT